MFKSFNPQTLPEEKKENLVTAIYIGAVFILLAVVYFANLPNSLWNSLINFFSTLTLAPVPGTGFGLPAPQVPSAHIVLYTAAFQLALGVGIVEILILAIRVLLRSPVDRKAETIGNLVFWLGASYLIITYLVDITIMSEWFVFWAGIIVVGGLALVARAFILIAKRWA